MIKSSMIQVLINILVNAKEILVSNKIEQAEINITIDETKEVITISICDNAGGIPESIMDKIGQPYFTTKKELNGVGLGLYISRTILEKHLCGTLTWHNEDKGACFVITLLANNLFKSAI
jgi:C4-dicarboxylate-specific signal transduction histidine kinase